jgi:hypothetical protein
MASISSLGRNGPVVWLENPGKFCCGMLLKAPANVVIVEVRVGGYEGGREILSTYQPRLPLPKFLAMQGDGFQIHPQG